MTYESIYTNIRTTAERGITYAAIETLLDALYKKSTDFNQLIETEMPHALVRPVKQQLTKLRDPSPQGIQFYLEGLREALGALATLSLEIAFDPTEETLSVLTAWIREHLGANIIMEISVDRSIFGGARVSYAGRYKEINLAILIENAMRQQKESIEYMLVQ